MKKGTCMADLSSTSRVYQPKVRTGDKVAVLSPSSGLPEMYPAVYEQGLQRLREIFHLEPVEYPTTRKMHSSPQDRARDIHTAFADPEIKAAISSIGGDDQLKVLKYLDPEMLKTHPKAFFGYSDNTNLLNFLWNLGIVSYHGGSIMDRFGRSGAMHPYTLESLKPALSEQGEFEIYPSPTYTDEDKDWNDPANPSSQPKLFSSSGWTWQNAERVVEGTLWGGNLEIVDWNLQANRYIQPVATYAGPIFYFETSADTPSSPEPYTILMSIASRAPLQHFPP